VLGNDHSIAPYQVALLLAGGVLRAAEGGGRTEDMHSIQHFVVDFFCPEEMLVSKPVLNGSCKYKKNPA
jgi:hypothetical protein